MSPRSLAAALFVLAWPSVAASAPERYPGDAQEVATTRLAHPHAVELLEKGEALATAGALPAAVSLFREGEAEAPSFSLLRRRECEALTALGRRPEAVDACTHALEDRRVPVNLRALIRAMVDGPAPPPTNELFQALGLVAIESKQSPGTATSPAMACHIAARIGDGVMLQRCVEDLERIDPADPEAVEALTLLQSRCPRARFWGGWLAIVLTLVLTIVHALRDVALRFRRGATAVAAAVFLATTALPGQANANPEQPPGGWLSKKWPVDDANPEKGIPSESERNKDPLEFGYWLQDVALKAERASKLGDHLGAVRFYRALAQAVPDRAIAFIKMCDEYEALGDREKAAASCGQALVRDGVTVRDFTRFVRLVLAQPRPLNEKEVAALAQVIQHMKNDPEGRKAVDEVECEVGMRTSNLDQLRECTANLAASRPDDPRTITYQWALAVREDQFARADALIERARTLGVSVDAMKQETERTAKRHQLRVILVLSTIALVLAGAAVSAVARIRRKPIRRTVESV